MVLRLLARLLHKRGEIETSLLLYAGYTALGNALGITLIQQAAAREAEQSTIDTLRRRLPDDTAERVWSRGLTVEWEDALHAGLERLGQHGN
jgi:hypothetical protein